MDNLSNIVQSNGFAATIYYIGATIAAIFCAGYYIRAKLESIASEAIVSLEKRVTILETDTLRKPEYEKDLKILTNTLQDLRQDVRAGIINLTSRLDTFILSVSDHKD